jgi:hypothetical protein
MRVIALLATYNEARFIGAQLEHLAAHGIEAYLIDNESTDDTVAIAERHLGRGLASIETLPRDGVSRLRVRLARKEELAASLDADWFIHLDADEFRLAPRSGQRLADALAEVDALGYNAVTFQEFTFLPTRESPDHDHPAFQRTMRWYFPFTPFFPHRLSAWKRQPRPVDLTWLAGHIVRFPGLRMYPRAFPMRHYLSLSVEHAMRKYACMRYDEEEIRQGVHARWRGRMYGTPAATDPGLLRLPSARELRVYTGDDALDARWPRRRARWLEEWAARATGEEYRRAQGPLQLSGERRVASGE